MPICYGNSGGVGRFVKRVEQPLCGEERDPGAYLPPQRRSRHRAKARLQVRSLDTGAVYESARAAGRAIAPENDRLASNAGKEISRCCRGERASWRGTRWEYVEKNAG